MSPSVHTHFFHQYTSIPVCTISWFDIMPKAIPGKCDNCEWCEANGQDWCMKGQFLGKGHPALFPASFTPNGKDNRDSPLSLTDKQWSLEMCLWNVFHAATSAQVRAQNDCLCWMSYFFFDPPQIHKPFQNWQSQNPNEREPHELVKITERRMKQTGKQQMIKCRTMSLTSRCRTEWSIF